MRGSRCNLVLSCCSAAVSASLAGRATAPAQAMAAMERVRQALRNVSFDDVAPGLVVTFSAGVSECAGEGDLEAAIARADAAMYEAKRAGRDRVIAGAQAPRPQLELAHAAA